MTRICEDDVKKPQGLSRVVSEDDRGVDVAKPFVMSDVLWQKKCYLSVLLLKASAHMIPKRDDVQLRLLDPVCGTLEKRCAFFTWNTLQLSSPQVTCKTDWPDSTHHPCCGRYQRFTDIEKL